MTTHVRYNATTLVAGADLTAASNRFKPVTIGGTIAGSGVAAVGLLLNSANTGEHITVGYEGEMKAYAGGAITAGNGLYVNSTGFMTAAASGSLSVGVALETAASGDLFRGLFNFVNAN